MSTYNLFSLPRDLLETTTLRRLRGATPPRAETPPPAPPPSSGSLACTICVGASFADVNEQRLHFRSDWHRYNVKLKLMQKNTVNETQFSNLIEALEDSLSGSASSSDESSSSSPDAVRTLLSKSKSTDARRSPSPTLATALPKTAISWFHSPPSTQIGVYNAIFDLSSPPSSYTAQLKEMQKGGPNGALWAMFMVAGGHFAGLVVRVRRSDQANEVLEKNKGKAKKPPPDLEVIHHKTFHRYTTRRKQGGSQSVNDNAKGPAKSAGALLRRYGEQALRDDIRNLMSEWREDIVASERIWIRASVSNKRIFYDYEDSAFGKADDRLRSFPFPTRRPTLSELTRCLTELTRVKVSHLTEEELRAQDEAYLSSLPKPKPPPAPATPAPKPADKDIPKLSKEEEALREKWRRVLEMVRKGRLEPLKSFWEREGESLGGVDARIPDWVEKGNGANGTLLHLAASNGQEGVTEWLLKELKANPTLPVALDQEVDERLDNGDVSDASDAPPPRPAATTRRTAYDLASSRNVRNIFRRCAAEHPDWWDWLGEGRVPSILSREMEEEREGKKKGRRKGLKEKVKQREAAAKQNEQEQPPEPVAPAKVEVGKAGPRRLGGASGAAESVAGLTPEMRARIERERRARAAEARMRAAYTPPGGL